MKPYWWKEAVIYQIYPRSFMDSNGDGIGDLQGIISKLDYLKELGVDCVWMSPCFKSPNVDMGYDISDYKDIMEDFGNMADCDKLIEEMHKRGIKLLMDLVPNHTSTEHPWFKESSSSRDNPKRDWYFWRDAKPDGSLPNNWNSFFSGPAWQWDEKTQQYYLHLFCKEQADINWDNPQVRHEIYETCKFWLDKGVDGFRMDCIAMISKAPGLPDGKPDPFLIGHEWYTHGPNIHKYLQEFNREVLSKYDIATVGECQQLTSDIASDYSADDRHELNMVFQFEIHEQLDNNMGDKWTKRDWKLSEYKRLQTKWQKALYGKCWNPVYLMNHDQPRPVSRWTNDSPQWRVKAAQMLGTMNHTLFGTPFVYQGEELGMTNVAFPSVEDYRDVEIHNYWKHNVVTGKRPAAEAMERIHSMARDNARTPMQWNKSENAGFTTGKPWIGVNPNYKEINAEDEMKDPNSVFNYYKKLIHLRKNHKIMAYGEYDEYYPEDEHLYVYTRKWEGQMLFVALNWTTEVQQLKIPDGVDLTGAKLFISNYENTDTVPTQLRGYEAIVYIK